MFMKKQKSVVGGSASYGIAENAQKNMSELTEGFLDYARYELNFSPQTIKKYGKSLEYFVRDIGDKPVGQYEVQEFVKLKRLMMERGNCETTIAGIVYAVRSFLFYCKNFLGLAVLNPKQIRPPRRFKREVIFLTKEEIEAFLNTIDVKKWNGLRFRAIVEILLGSGMRIGETLSLNRKDIKWEKREAKIIGKGNKERTVFFTQRSLDWLSKYLERRNDTHEAIFTTRKPIARLDRNDIWRFFDRHRKLAKIDKKLTPHILRHTVATNLIFNGCPIVHVKEILGHERLDTTCKYYLEVDKEKAKKAHKQYLDF
jgi:site-specific recombinase XerD